MKSLGSDLYKLRDRAIDAVRNYKAQTVRTKQYANDVINIYTKVEQAAKNIGIEIPNDTVKRKTEAEEMSKRTTKLQSKIEQMLKSL